MAIASMTTADFKGERLSLKMFGAKGDGTTDDTAAVQAAFDSGEHIFAGAGRYLLTAAIVKDLTAGAGFCLNGVGEASKFLLGNKDAGLEMYGADSSTTRDNRCLLKKFSIDCKSTNGSAAAALFMNKTAIWGIEDVRIHASLGYRRWTIDDATLVSLTVAAGVATVETSTAHNISEGDAVTVSGSDEDNLNDAYLCSAVGDDTHFSFPIYDDFPVDDGAFSETDLAVAISRVQSAIKLAGAQKGHIYGGSLESAAYGIQLLRQDGIGSNQVAIQKSVNFSDCYMTAAWYNGVDDGTFVGNHVTQGRYSIWVQETGSGGVYITANHFEYMRRVGYFQEGGRATVLDNKFYNDGSTVSAYIPTASDIRFCFNQCNRDIHFGPDGEGSSGVFYGLCCFNMLGGGEIYEGERLPHFMNLHMSGTGPASNAVMRLWEPSYEWLYTPVGGTTIPDGPVWKFLGPGFIPGKYLLGVRGEGSGPSYDFTADAGTDVITATGHTFTDGEAVTITSDDTLPGGLTGRRIYRVRDAAADVFKLAHQPGGAAVDITSAGTGTHTVKVDNGAGALLNQAAEIFAPTSNDRMRFALPEVVGDEVASRIALVVDANGVQLPFGGTGVDGTAKGNLIVGVDAASRTNLAPGADGTVLTSNAATGTGLDWQTLDGLLEALTGDIETSGIIRSKNGSNTIELEATAGSIVRLISANAELHLGSSDVAYVRLRSNATDFIILDPINGMVMFGGTTSGFPGLLRVSDTLHVKTADNSAFAGLHLAVALFHAAGMQIYLGGTTSSNCAISGSGSTVKFRLGDDSGDAPITAAGANLSALTASLPVKTDSGKNLSSGAIDLSGAEVTNILPLAQGGTGSSSGAAARAALGAAATSGIGSGSVTLAKLTPGGANGSITWNADGVITGFVAPS